MKLTVVMVVVAAGGTACYHPEPLDPGAVMNDLRASDPIGRASPRPGGSAAGPAAAATPLSEDRSVAIALLWNRELRAFRLTRGIAEGEIMSAAALSNPELRLEMTHLQRRDLAQAGWDVRVSWAPPQPGVRAGQRGAAAARLDEVDKQIGEKEWALACDVRTAHLTLLALDEQIRVAQDTIENRRRLGEVVERRVARGGTTRFDLDLVRLSLASAAHAESQRRLERALAANALVQLLGVGPPGGTVEVAGRLDTEPPNLPQLSQNDLEDRALATRPALAAARAHYVASEQTLRAETAARWPWLRFSAAPRVRRNEFVGATTDLVFGIDVTVPVFDTNRGKVRSAQSARDTARAEVTSTLAGLRTDIARALASVEAQQSILKRLQAEIVPLLAEHDRVMALGAQALEVDLPALIASENLVLESRIELITARTELRKAWIALERAVGARVSASGAPPRAEK